MNSSKSAIRRWCSFRKRYFWIWIVWLFKRCVIQWFQSRFLLNVSYGQRSTPLERGCYASNNINWKLVIISWMQMVQKHNDCGLCVQVELCGSFLLPDKMITVWGGAGLTSGVTHTPPSFPGWHPDTLRTDGELQTQTQGLSDVCRWRVAVRKLIRK